MSRYTIKFQIKTNNDDIYADIKKIKSITKEYGKWRSITYGLEAPRFELFNIELEIETDNVLPIKTELIEHFDLTNIEVRKNETDSENISDRLQLSINDLRETLDKEPKNKTTDKINKLVTELEAFTKN